MLNIKNKRKIIFALYVFLQLIYIEKFFKINIINAAIENSLKNMFRDRKIYEKNKNPYTLKNKIIKLNDSIKNRKNIIFNKINKKQTNSKKNKLKYKTNKINPDNINSYNIQNNSSKNENVKKNIDYNNFALFFNTVFPLMINYLHIYNNLLDLVGINNNINEQIKPILHPDIVKEIESLGLEFESCFSNFYLQKQDNSILENIKNIIINHTLDKNNYKNTFIENNKDAIDLMNKYINLDIYQNYINKILKINSNGEETFQSIIKIKLNSQNKNFVLQNLEETNQEDIVFYNPEIEEEEISKFSVEMFIDRNYLNNENNQTSKKYSINDVLFLLNSSLIHKKAMFIIFIANSINEALKSDPKNVIEKIKKIIELRCKKEDRELALDVTKKALNDASITMQLLNEYTIYYNNADFVKKSKEIIKKNNQLKPNFNLWKIGKWIGGGSLFAGLVYLGGKNLGWIENIPFGETITSRLKELNKYFKIENLKKEWNKFNDNNDLSSKLFKAASLNPMQSLLSAPLSKAYNVLSGNDQSIKGISRDSFIGDVVGEFSSKTASSGLTSAVDSFGIMQDLKFLDRSLLKNGTNWIIDKFFSNAKIYLVWRLPSAEDSIFLPIFLIKKTNTAKSIYMKLFEEYKKTKDKYSGYAESVVRVLGKKIDRDNIAEKRKGKILILIEGQETKKYIGKLLDRAAEYGQYSGILYASIQKTITENKNISINELKNKIINNAISELENKQAIEINLIKNYSSSLYDQYEQEREKEKINEKYKQKIDNLKKENFQNEFFGD
jgi:hypothetical protein